MGSLRVSYQRQAELEKIHVSLKAAVNLSQYDVVYKNTISQEAAKADASATTTAPAIGICKNAITSGNTGDILVLGEIENSGWTWTEGAELFLSETAAALTETAPTTSGSVVQKVATAITATKIFINPERSFVINS